MKKLIKCSGVTLAVDVVNGQISVTVAKGVFVFTEHLTLEQAERLTDALTDAQMEVIGS